MSLLKPEYNIFKTAGSPIGYKHTKATRELMSLVKSGEKNPMYGREGDKNPNYGNPNKYKPSPETKEKMSIAQGTTIFLNSSELTLVDPFTSSRAAAKDLKSAPSTITSKMFARSGKIIKEKYILSLKELPAKPDS